MSWLVLPAFCLYPAHVKALAHAPTSVNSGGGPNAVLTKQQTEFNSNLAPNTQPSSCHWMDMVQEHNPGRQVCGADLGHKFKWGSAAKRLALVVRGESFRSGAGKNDRVDCVTSDSLRWQAQASKSHVRYFIEPIEACGVAVDVFLATYVPVGSTIDVNSSQQLIDFYTPERVARTLFLPQSAKLYQVNVSEADQGLLFHQSLQLVIDHSQHAEVDYMAVFVVRFDMILKLNIPLTYSERPWHKILFSSMANWDPKLVCDMIEWFPWPYVNCAVKTAYGDHFFGANLKAAAGEDSVDFLISKATALENNEMYKVVRPPKLLTEEIGNCVGPDALPYPG